MLIIHHNEAHPKMRGTKTKQLTWIGLSLVLMLVLMGAGCQRRAVTNEIIDNTLNVTPDNTIANNPVNNATPNNSTPPSSGVPDPAAILASLKEETMDATARIKTLVIGGQPKTDLVLTIVSSKFINTLADTGLDTNWYIYTTPSDPANFYLINMPRNGAGDPKRIIMPKSDFQFDFDVLPIPMDQWKKSYADALVFAEQKGGATFRAQHKTFETSVILAYPAAGQQVLSWSVAYKATDSSGASFKVQVNAATGDTVVVP